MWLIPISASHFQVIFVSHSLWHCDCLFQCRVLCNEMAGRFGIMDTLRATDIYKDSDGALVAAARRGDTQAFEELVLRYRRGVFAMARPITNNHEDAEDILQNSFNQA